MRIIKQITNFNTIPQVELLKVAAYCRISTLHENQLYSLDNQVSYYENEIKKNIKWEFAGVYADKASGRNRSKRKEFQKMLLDCNSGKINLILTKSISRFGRNTLDTLKGLNELKNLGIDVYFENEKMYLLQKNSELMLTIYAAFYQNESEEKSYNIKWGIKRSFESGNSKYQNRICYGYCNGVNGRLIIDYKEAIIVQEIFHLYLRGYSLRQLACELNSRGIISPRGLKKWSVETINKLLSNEKYTGNVLLQKSIVNDYFSGKQIINQGQVEKYFISGSNPAIISEEQFNKVQLEKKYRGTAKIKNL